MKKIFTIIISLAFFTSLGAPASANLRNAFTGDNIKAVAGGAGYRENTNADTLMSQISIIISVFLSLLGVIFLILMIYGGYLWMMDQGNNDKMKKAKSLMTAAVIGLMIIIFAYIISYFIFYKLSQGALKSGGYRLEGSEDANLEYDP